MREKPLLIVLLQCACLLGHAAADGNTGGADPIGAGLDAGTTNSMELKEEALHMINHFRQQQLGLAEPLTWDNALVPAASRGAGSDHYGSTRDEEVEITEASFKDRSRVLFSLLEAIWTKSFSQCLDCRANRCIVKLYGCGYPYEMFYEDAKRIGCLLVLSRGNAGAVLAKMKCSTSPPAQINSILKSFDVSAPLKPLSPPPLAYGHAPQPLGQAPPVGRPYTVASAAAFQMPWASRGQTPQDLPMAPTPPAAPAQSPAPLAGAGTVWPPQQQPTQPAGSSRKSILIPLAPEHFERVVAIDVAEGGELARVVNISRAAISKRRLAMPPTAAMPRVTWSGELATRAFHRLNSRDSHYIDVIDLQFIEMLPQFANRPPTLKFRQLSIELDLQNLLMWLVKQYFKQFASRRAIRCSRKTCRPRCKGANGKRRMDCYAYELIHDKGAQIGCAVKFHKLGGPTLKAELVCVLDKELQFGDALYHVGAACSGCPNNCDRTLKLCLPAPAAAVAVGP